MFHEASDFDDRIQKLQNIVFHIKPPTPQEFLDYHNGWISKQTAGSLWDSVKENFCNILDRKKRWTAVVLTGSQRQGKSVLLRLIAKYTISYFHCVRDVHAFFDISPLTNIVMYLICFQYEKVKELMLGPILKQLADSERFEQVKFKDKVKELQEKAGYDKVIYSTASRVGELTLASGLQMRMGNDNSLNILGADLYQTYFTEIAFFIEKVGASEDEIYRLLTDSMSRRKRTVGLNKYLSFTFIDTSANDKESKIEKFLHEVMQQDPSVYFSSKAQWEIPELGKNVFPMWTAHKTTFEVFVGSPSKEPFIIQNEHQKTGLHNDLIIKVPIDVKQEFEVNILRAIRDIAGIPTTSEARFIQNPEVIDNMFCDPNLPNVISTITADSASEPDGLLWNQTWSTFFHQHLPNQFVMKRAPIEGRYLGLDFAASANGDLLGLCLLHKEWSRTQNKVMYVVDMVFGVKPGKTGINLDSIELFILDLCIKGKVSIIKGYIDTWQSETFVQNLKRRGLQVEKNSVTRDMTAYVSLRSSLYEEPSGRIRAGRNIILRNNLRCLKQIKMDKAEKIDHSYGERTFDYHGDWETSRAGFHANDVSDALCQALAAAKADNLLPTVVYEEESRRFSSEARDKSESIRKAAGLLRPRNLL